MKTTMMAVPLSTNMILERAGTYFGDSQVLYRLPDKLTATRSDDAALRAYLQPKLARFQVPDDFEWVDAIPKTATGKFLKTKLREMHRERVSVSP